MMNGCYPNANCFGCKQDAGNDVFGLYYCNRVIVASSEQDRPDRKKSMIVQGSYDPLLLTMQPLNVLRVLCISLFFQVHAIRVYFMGPVNSSQSKMDCKNSASV